MATLLDSHFCWDFLTKCQFLGSLLWLSQDICPKNLILQLGCTVTSLLLSYYSLASWRFMSHIDWSVARQRLAGLWRDLYVFEQPFPVWASRLFFVLWTIGIAPEFSRWKPSNEAQCIKSVFTPYSLGIDPIHAPFVPLLLFSLESSYASFSSNSRLNSQFPPHSHLTWPSQILPSAILQSLNLPNILPDRIQTKLPRPQTHAYQ